MIDANWFYAQNNNLQNIMTIDQLESLIYSQRPIWLLMAVLTALCILIAVRVKKTRVKAEALFLAMLVATILLAQFYSLTVRRERVYGTLLCRIIDRYEPGKILPPSPRPGVPGWFEKGMQNEPWKTRAYLEEMAYLDAAAESPYETDDQRESPNRDRVLATNKAEQAVPKQ